MQTRGDPTWSQKFSAATRILNHYYRSIVLNQNLLLLCKEMIFEIRRSASSHPLKKSSLRGSLLHDSSVSHDSTTARRLRRSEQESVHPRTGIFHQDTPVELKEYIVKPTEPLRTAASRVLLREKRYIFRDHKSSHCWANPLPPHSLLPRRSLPLVYYSRRHKNL